MRIDPSSRQVTNDHRRREPPLRPGPGRRGGVDRRARGHLHAPRRHPARQHRRLSAQFASDPVGLGPQASLVYDGLVAYRRAGGSAGTALVADLAADLPAPSPDGRTYRFRLRPNLRFSDGAPVTPEDVRASLARLLAFGDPGYYDELDAIPGAARCADAARPARARFERCDLSEGVETDAAARTITFHLTRPDPDFLHKLHSLLIVPAGSPPRPVEHTAAAGHRPVHDRALGPAAGRAAGPQPALPRLVTRSARRLPRPDHDPVPAAEGPDRRVRGRRGGHRRVRRPDPRGRSAQGALRRTAAHRPRSGDRVRVPQRPRAAVRRRPRPASAQLRRRSRPARRAPGQRDAQADLPDAAPGLAGIHAGRVPSPSTPTPPVPGRARTWPGHAGSSPPPGRAA